LQIRSKFSSEKLESHSHALCGWLVGGICSSLDYYIIFTCILLFPFKIFLLQNLRLSCQWILKLRSSGLWWYVVLW